MPRVYPWSWEPGRPRAWRRVQPEPSPSEFALTPARGAAAFFILAYLFCFFSRLLDFGFSSLHLPLLLSVMGLAAVFVTSTYWRAVSSRSGLFLLGLTGWMIIGTLLSIWRGGSVAMLTNMWFKSLAIFIMTASLLRTPRQCVRAVQVIAVAVLSSATLALFKGSEINGRRSIEGTAMSNANDFGLLLLLSLPLWCFLITRPGTPPLRKGVNTVCLLVVLASLAHTGSRGTMIGLAGAALALFWMSSLAGKARMIVLGTMLVVTAVTVVPRPLLERYTTYFSADDDQDTGADVAVASTEGRIYLLKKSLWLTARHPLFGVGPGMFMVAENNDAVAAGQWRGAWHETHNMYTQVSSECGIPGLLLFLGAIWFAFSGVNGILRARPAPADPRAELVRAAFWLRLSLIGVCCSGFFLSIAYTPLLPVIEGLVVAMENALQSAPETVRIPLAPRRPAFAWAPARS